MPGRACTAQEIALALGVLDAGGVVACPTETYYGLCALYSNISALERIFALKGREKVKPSPLVAGSIEALDALELVIDPVSRSLMERFWPGPLTIILKTRKELPQYIAKNGKLAIRVPGPSFALELAKASGTVLTATSANPSGLPPATDDCQIAAYFGSRVDLIVKGRAAGGKPSTIVEASDGKITVLREGAIPAGMLEIL
ncbi:MAG: L-threonylcarbamoyladenylate synthase [Actinomycetota bacterium]|nr:L-threonylcarbamoyladenylate synthase [Actinomycetota bacterium]